MKPKIKCDLCKHQWHDSDEMKYPIVGCYKDVFDPDIPYGYLEEEKQYCDIYDECKSFEPID